MKKATAYVIINIMPKGPRGQKRPADVIGNAIVVAKIATGEITEEANGKEYAREGGRKGGALRLRNYLLPDEKKLLKKPPRPAGARKKISPISPHK